MGKWGLAIRYKTKEGLKCVGPTLNLKDNIKYNYLYKT